MLTESDLQQIMPRLPQAKRQLYLPFINRVMEVYEIDTPLRASAFLAQIAHESAELRFMEEIWGPTAQQKKYEPPSDVATRLGNTQPGDGFRYRGRGPIQITGRSNYQTFGGQLGVDLVGNPDLAATPQIAFSTAGLFWKMNGLNELADVEDFIAITRRINGGLNGLADRRKYYEIAKNVLGAEEPGDFAFSAAPVAPGAGDAPVNETFDLPPPVLPRGQESIELDFATMAAASTASQDETKPVAKKKSGQSDGKPVKKLVPVKKAASEAAKKVAKRSAKKAPRKVASNPAKRAAKSTTRVATSKSSKKAMKKSAAKKGVKARKKAFTKKSR